MKIEARAKVNLFLRILGKRSDGFHQLETLMAPISLYDSIELEEIEDEIEIQVRGMNLSAGKDNLAYRAALEVRKKVRIKRGVRITIDKRIPLGGGLAGGSSNCAAVIKGVNDLWQAGLGEEQLHEIAASLGSDINFFLQDSPAICSGRGEKISPVLLEHDLFAVLINPGFGVETPWAFKTYAKNPKIGKEGQLSIKYKKSDDSPSDITKLRNDLEPPVFEKYIWLSGAKNWLLRQEGVLDAMMSGSGATVFALVDSEQRAAALISKSKEIFGSTTWIQHVSVHRGI
ncbi:MAG: 4-(cytidine 5'-diphospho)-2-C-methyl-D-erythritol kinase [Verrucomicrobiota bacterium]